MSNVVDLLSRRQSRGDNPLHFTSAADALAFATTQIRELQHLRDSALFLDARELDLPLAQTASILAECTRLHALIPHQENA